MNRPNDPLSHKNKTRRSHTAPSHPEAGRAVAATGKPHAKPVASGRMSAERLLRIERRKARTRAVWLAVFVVLIMFLTVVMIITIMQRTRPKPRFQFIQTGEITRTVRTTALILRDEQVFNSPTAGTLKALATEGSRAAKGQKVALIIPPNRETQLMELQKVEKDIVDLQNDLMNSGKGAGAKAIYDESLSQLSTIINLVRSDTTRDDLSSLHAYQTSMEVIMEQRNTRLLSIDFKDARLEQLKSAKLSLEATLGLAAGTVVCPKPGIISFRLDGLESELTTELAASMTYTDFLTYRDKAGTTLAPIISVTEGQPVLRITSSLNQVICLELTDISPDLFEVGKRYKLTVPQDGMTINECLVLRSEPHNEKQFIVFQTDRKVEWLSDRRTFEAELTVAATTGMKVPISSIMNLDPETKEGQLLIVQGGYTRISRVLVTDQDREYAIIEPVADQPYKPVVSTVMVLNPNAIEEGEFIGN